MPNLGLSHMKAQRLLTGAAIIITLLLGFWFARHLLPPPIKLVPFTHGTDYTAQNITLTQFHTNGQLRYRLTATHLAHTLPDRLTRLSQPILMVYPEQGTPITLSSPSAILKANDTIIKMPERVLLTGADGRGRPIRILSSNVTVDTQQQTATSPAPTQINGPGYVTLGDGLDVSLRQQIFNLLKDVRSVYSPADPK